MWYSPLQWVISGVLALGITVLFVFARSPSGGGETRGGARSRITNVPKAYREESLRNQGMVPRGSPAARVAEAASTDEVRDAYRQACKRNGGYIPKGSDASQKAAEEAQRMRMWPPGISSPRGVSTQ